MGENRFSKLFEDADALFDSKYSSEIKALHGMSEEEIMSISGETDGMKTYSVLIKVVEQAAKENMTQAELAGHIKELGSLALKIAGKVPGLKAIIE